MTTKDFLQQAYYAQREIEIKLEQIVRLNSLTTRTTTNLKATPSGQSSGSVVENALIKLDEQIKKLADEINQLLKISDEISGAIALVNNSSERQVLKYRYLCFFSWQQIALLMKMSERQLYRLHDKAIKNFQLMSPNVSGCH